MAVDPAVASVAASQQASQAALVSLLADPLANAWGLLDVNQPSTLDRFIQAIQALVHHFGKASGSEAARFYAAERRAARISGSFTPRLGPVAPADKVESSVRWATQSLWTPNPDIETAQTLVQGVTEKNVLDVYRDTTIGAVQADRKAKGWYRETKQRPCYFCALMAGRGAVYKSEQTAEFKPHDGCHCVPRPIFTAYEPSARVREWQQLYRDSTKGAYGPKASRAAFRKAFESQ